MRQEAAAKRPFLVILGEAPAWERATPLGKGALLATGGMAAKVKPVVENQDGAVLKKGLHEIQDDPGGLEEVAVDMNHGCLLDAVAARRGR
jgi:hypothetical protein